mmetsp:Transcript_23468/g.79266  ORF Transcript_23468/g.79266 Transcript_23468/m.79266 type:complete len:258 (+) Transcript_23468:1408-2181(+)
MAPRRRREAREDDEAVHQAGDGRAEILEERTDAHEAVARGCGGELDGHSGEERVDGTHAEARPVQTGAEPLVGDFLVLLGAALEHLLDEHAQLRARRFRAAKAREEPVVAVIVHVEIIALEADRSEVVAEAREEAAVSLDAGAEGGELDLGDLGLRNFRDEALEVHVPMQAVERHPPALAAPAGGKVRGKDDHLARDGLWAAVARVAVDQALDVFEVDALGSVVHHRRARRFVALEGDALHVQLQLPQPVRGMRVRR